MKTDAASPRPCPKCSSGRTVPIWNLKPIAGDLQYYRCNDCGHGWTEPNGESNEGRKPLGKTK
jgi:transposase-like protein